MSCLQQDFFSDLCSLCDAFGRAVDRHAVLEALARGCVKVMGVKASLVRLLDEKNQRLRLGAAYGLSDEYLDKGPVEPDKSPLDMMVLGGEKVVIEDVTEDKRMLYPEVVAREGIRSLLSVPFRVGDRIVGVLRLYRSDVHRFSDEEVRMATTMAIQAGIALEKAILQEQARALREVSQAISASLDVSTVLETIVRSAAQILGFRAASLRLLDEEGNSLEVKATYGLSDAYLAKGPVEVGKSLLDQEVLSGKVVSISDGELERRLQYPEEARQEGVRSILCLPLTLKKRRIGVLRVYGSLPYEFRPSEIDFLTALASQGAIAIENARLFEHLKRDYEDLTRDVWRWYDWGERPPRL